MNLFHALFLPLFSCFLSYIVGWKFTSRLHMANPITSAGSNYGREVVEENAFQWFDEAFIHVRAGSGGPGSAAVKFGKGRQHMKPSGGNGGDGDSSFNTLLRFRGRSKFAADSGKPGDADYATGSNGANCYVTVPRGVLIKDNETDQLICELTEDGQVHVVAKGGQGGRGNAALNTKGVEKGICISPQGGQKRWLKLELKLVADIGLIGVPNAGKSTLLDAVTNARPKIANYAFTTIVPNLGVCEVGGSVADGGDAMVIADIPGLIEGAHMGVGLGRGFLRHVERCKMLIHIVNGNSDDPLRDFHTINRELQMFSPLLATKPQVVVLNKIDIPDVAGRKNEILAELQRSMSHKRLLCISAQSRIGVDELVTRAHQFLKKLTQDESRNDASQIPTLQEPEIVGERVME